MFKTGELSKVFEIDRTSLNYYIKLGLLNPDVQENQYYQYSFEDVVALSYIRYYRGLGFNIQQTKSLTQEADHETKIELFHEQLDKLSEEIQLLRMKQRFLEHLKNSVQFHIDYHNASVIIVTEGYYFIKKEDIHDSVLMELYKMTPSNEFEVEFDDDYSVNFKSMKSSQGLALKEEWVQEFGLVLPEECIYYPPEKKCICSWRVQNENIEKKMKDFIIQMDLECKEKGYRIQRDFIVYVLMNHYHTKQQSMDLFVQFHLKDID